MVSVVLVFISVFLGPSFGAVPRRLSSKHDGRIVGGTPANITNFPYQLSLEYYTDSEGFKHICGALVISEEWALTAAHCVNGFQVSRLRLRGGTSFRERGGKIYKIAKIISHPKFNKKHTDYDIAVIKVSKPFRYSDVLQPINLALTTPSIGTMVVATGWGSLSFEGDDATQLQTVAVNVIGHEECKEAYEPLNKIVTSRMLCAGVPKGGKDTCGGDSGGPLVANGNQLVGVVSWGNSCADRRYPGVYVDVAYFIDWIISVTETTWLQIHLDS